MKLEYINTDVNQESINIPDNLSDTQKNNAKHILEWLNLLAPKANWYIHEEEISCEILSCSNLSFEIPEEKPESWEYLDTTILDHIVVECIESYITNLASFGIPERLDFIFHQNDTLRYFYDLFDRIALFTRYEPVIKRLEKLNGIK